MPEARLARTRAAYQDDRDRWDRLDAATTFAAAPWPLPRTQDELDGVKEVIRAIAGSRIRLNEDDEPGYGSGV